MENLIQELKQFNYYKQLILSDETNGRNIIVEKKDGTHAILTQKISNIPGLAANISEIERITVFVDGKEFEFVSCQ